MNTFKNFCSNNEIEFKQLENSIQFGFLSEEKIFQVIQWKRHNSNLGFLYHDKFLGLVYKFFSK